MVTLKPIIQTINRFSAGIPTDGYLRKISHIRVGLGLSRGTNRGMSPRFIDRHPVPGPSPGPRPGCA